MKDHGNTEKRAPISGWEDDGGAQPSGAAPRPDKPRAAVNTRRSEQARLDASHESDARGEHRYDDRHQTAAEQEARQKRDELKQRLAGHVARRGRS